MRRNLPFFIVLIIFILFAAEACEKVYNLKDDNETIYTFDTTIVVKVNLNGNSISVDPEVADISGSKLTINSAGTYDISGSLTEGQIVVYSSNKGIVRLILDGVNIKCSNSAPVYIKNADKVAVSLPEGKTNSLTDGTSYITADGEPSATLFSNSDITIYGEGTLNISANYNDGISTDDGLVIKSGTISVNSCDDGIRGKDYIVINDGNITVNSKGDGLKSTNETDAAKGYISIDKGTFNITATAGDGISAITNLKISDGTFNILTGNGAVISTTTGGGFPGGGPGGGSSGGYSGTISEKAIKADGSISITKGTFTINAADDAFHSHKSVTITDGIFSLASGDDAINAAESITINGGSIDITKCYEGIESALITINNGNINLASTDDGINATKGAATENDDGSYAYIKGGNITINSSTGDGLDSNGSVEMSGGTLIIHGPQSSPEVGFDINGIFKITGGFMVASGPNSGNMIETPSTSSTLYSVKVTASSTLSSSTLFHIEDQGKNDIVTFKPVRSVYYIVVASSKLTTGTTFNIYTGGTSSGTNTNGLYTGGTYSGGTLKKSFTLSSKVTNVSF